ncbi:hypothetical protein SAMN05444673_5846 [Bacillus sp. OV166]|nr:hypothetical protein SAMN05444673_5846 [Bacillus sp. OV166]
MSGSEIVLIVTSYLIIGCILMALFKDSKWIFKATFILLWFPIGILLMLFTQLSLFLEKN